MRPTAETVARPYQLSGKVAVVTGSNIGIGFETARALAGAGALVIITSRSLKKAEDAATIIGANSKVGGVLVGRDAVQQQEAAMPAGVQGKAEALQLDLMDTESVHDCAEKIEASAQHIDFLILNAGLHGSVHCSSRLCS